MKLKAILYFVHEHLVCFFRGTDPTNRVFFHARAADSSKQKVHVKPDQCSSFIDVWH